MRLDELFRSKLHNAEAEVPKGVWDKLEAGLDKAMPQSGGLSSSSGAELAASTKASAIVGKTIAGIALAAMAGGGIYLLNSNDAKEEKPIAKAETKIVETVQRHVESKAEKPVELSAKKNGISFSENVDLISENSVSEIGNNEMVKGKEKESSATLETFVPPVPETVQEERLVPAKPVKEKLHEQSIPQKEVCEVKQQQRKQVEPAFEPAIAIPNLISPNNDGINDRFEIRNLEQYPDNELIIFNRKGKVVFRAISYANDWAAEGLADGAYFYRFAVREGSKQKIFTGNINVMR